MAAGDTVTCGIFASAPIPPGVQLSLYIDTPGNDAPIAILSRTLPAVVLCGPGTYKISRENLSEYGVDVGAFTET